MPISQRHYVDIASAVVGAGRTAMQKLDGRVFTTSLKVPAQSILEFVTATEVRDYFGAGDEADFAAAYFALITPAPASRAKAIQFAPHLDAGRGYTIYGGKHENLAALKALTNETVDLDAGGTQITASNVSLAAASDFSSIASILTGLPGMTTNSVVFNYDDGRFSVTAPYTTPIELVIGQVFMAVGLDKPYMIDEGGPVQSMADAWLSAQDKSNSYGSSYFLARGSRADCVTVAELNAAENVRHQIYFQVEESEAQDFYDDLNGTASVGLILDDGQHVAHIPMALMSATNYQRANASLNYMFREAGVSVTPQVTSTSDAQKYDKIRVNYYGVTAVAASDIRFFQRGYLMGPGTAPLDMSVHAGEQWIKARFTQLWFDLLTGTRGIPANLDGKARATMVIAQVIEEAINNGVILRGKELTVTQKIAITDATDDDTAWMQIQTDGAWFNVAILTRTGQSGVEEYYLDYVLVYSKGDWVRKVEGSHNLV